MQTHGERGRSGELAPRASTLIANGRAVISSDVGPLEAEYGLFTTGDLELKASGVGQIREVGYQATAAEALAQLETLGVTAGLAERVANMLRGTLGEHFARGPIVRRHLGDLPTHLLLSAESYDSAHKVYRGRCLDFASIADELKLPNAGLLLQALSLAVLAVELPADVQLRLDTTVLTATRPIGYRSFARVRFGEIAALPDALLTLSKGLLPDRPMERDMGPSLQDLAQRVEDEVAWTKPSPQTERLKELVVLLKQPLRRTTGHLSLPELASIEEALDRGEYDAVATGIDLVETRMGKTPASTYLRSRLALLTGAEDPATVAQRAGAMALSLNNFGELAVLAAEAWLQAGDPARAMPFLQDVLSNPKSDDALRARAAQILDRALDSEAPPALVDEVEAAQIPPVAPAAPNVPAELRAPQATSDGDGLEVATVPSIGPTPRSPSVAPAPASQAHVPPASSLEVEPPTERLASRSVPPVAAITLLSEPPPSERPSAPPPSIGARAAAVAQSLGLEEPPPSGHPDVMAIGEGYTKPPLTRSGPLTAVPGSMPPPSSRGRPARSMTPLGLGPLPGFDIPKLDAPPELGSSPHLNPQTPAPPRLAEAPARQGSDNATDSSATVRPPGRSDKVPGEAAETLLPPAGSPEQVDGNPKNANEARTFLTRLTRELARDYRENFGVSLCMDLTGLEMVQANLLDAFPSGSARTAGEAKEVRRHAAFLSELLSRRLGAMWVELDHPDPAEWRMVVPPSREVTPFARVARYMKARHKERDLVSYFLELQLAAQRAMPPNT